VVSAEAAELQGACGGELSGSIARHHLPEIGKWHRQLPDALKAMIDVQAERNRSRA
jgi:hypothetical protein